MLILVILPFIATTNAQQFAPGCSFFNGQCVYNVKLGRQQNCNGGTGLNPRALDGGCSCDDVTKVATDLNILQSRLNKLKQSMTDFRNQLTNVEPKTNTIQSPVNSENEKYVQLLQTFHTKYDLLNRTDEEVTNILRVASSEIATLREQLRNTTGELASCKVSSGTTTSPLTVTNTDYTTFHCGFQSSDLCHFTQDRDDNTDWAHQKSMIMTSSGPKTDHSYGNNYGYYAALRTHDTSKYSAGKTTGRITSPTFQPASNYCVRFWYTLYGKDVDTLNVYAKVGNGRGYPVYTMSGNVSPYWQMAQIDLGPEYTKQQFKLTFEASYNTYKVSHHVSSHYVYNYYKDEGNIAIDDVYVYNTTCSNLHPYPKQAFARQDGNTTSYYTFHTSASTWYAAQETCRKENAKSSLAVVSDATEQAFLVNAINTHVDLIVAGQNGFYINGNDIDNENKFKWTSTGYPQNIQYTNFHQGQPNNVGDIQDCLLMEYPRFNYEWGDVACNEKHPFICEIHY